MADVNSNININFNTAAALAQLRSLQAGLSRFHQSLAEGNLAAANAQKGLNAQLIQSVGATGKFSASQVKVAGSTLAFTSALEKNKLSLREYYRYTMAAATANTRVMGKAFAQEREIINRARRDRVKALQAQYVQMNKSNAGFMDAIRIMPKSLQMASGKFTELGTRIQYAAQRQQFLNQLLKQGSTQLLNFGKNTQWAGRQLMVGMTMPLVLFGAAAAKSFRELETAIVKFKRVYGNAFTNESEINLAVENIRALATEYTKYGVAVKDTMDMAATAAAAGFTGRALTAQVETATKLAVLGQIEQQQALETTISLQNAFGLSSEELAKKIDFLNAVENQTVLSIEDLTIAIPKAAPIIKQLGGSVEDLAFFLTAMKEGGINASEGANALKSGLASMINPSKKAAAFLGDLGINIKGIVEANAGNLQNTIIGFAQALDTLDPLNRARAIEQMFGKFQFSRLSTLFQNVTKDSSQASRALSLAGSSVEELAILSEREMGKIEDSVGVKFQAAIEQFKQDIMPLGKIFLEALTPVVKFFGGLFEKFNGLGDKTKKIIAIVVGAVAGLGPVVLMTFGLLMNAVANGIKLFAMLRGGIAKLNGKTNIMGAGFNYMTQEQIENAASSSQLHQTHTRLVEVFNVEKTAVSGLAASYSALSTQMRAMASQNPALFAGGKPGAMNAVRGLPPVRKYKTGILSVPGPKGAGDVVPAMLSPGEAVIPTKTTNKYRGLISAMFKDKVPGFMAGRLPGGPGKGVPLSPGPKAVRDAQQARYRRINDARQGYSEPHPEKKTGPTFIGMPKSSSEATQSRQILDKISNQVRLGEFGSVPPTDFGTMLQSFSGRSFPARGVGGVYRKSNGQIVVVKPTIDAKTALAEVRATQIAREVHGLVSPKQTIRTMMDPTDPTGQRKFIVIESPYDPRIATMTGKFSKSEMVKQLVASTLRGDKDLQRPNLSGNVLSDVGTAGVFDRASGFRDFAKVMPSMEQQAIVNLLGVKGGAKKFFAQETSATAASMTPAQYDTAIKAEIRKSIPRLENLLKTWDKSLGPEEKIVYGNMLQRLKDGAKTDWAALQPMHARAGDGVIKAIRGINPESLSVEQREQLSRYSLASLGEEQSSIDNLKGTVNKQFLDRLETIDPDRARVIKAAWFGGKVDNVPPTGGSQSFSSPRQTTFLNELDKMTPVNIDGVTKYVHDDDMDAFASDPKGRAKWARTSQEVRDMLLYRMGAEPDDKGRFVANKKFTGRFGDLGAFTKTLRSTGKQSGGGIGNTSKIVKPFAKQEIEEYNKRVGNPLTTITGKQMLADGWSPEEVKDRLKENLSHIKKEVTGSTSGALKMKTGEALYDTRLLNNYLNADRRSSKILDWNGPNNILGLSDVEEYRRAADFMAKEQHPTNANERALLAKAAELDQIVINHKDKGNKVPSDLIIADKRVPKALRTLISDPRFQPGRLINLAAQSADQVLVNPNNETKITVNPKTKKVKEQRLTNANTTPKPIGAVADSGSRLDTRATSLGPNQSVVTRSQLLNFRRGFAKIPTFSMPGKIDGDPSVGKITSSDQLSKAAQKRINAGLAEKARLLAKENKLTKTQITRAIEKIRAQRTETEMTKANIRLQTQAANEAKKNALSPKQQKKLDRQTVRQARVEKIGRFSGGASMALGTAGMGLMMAGNEKGGMAMMGASAVAGLAPMLASPAGAVAAGLMVAVGALVAFNMALDKAKKEGIALGNAMSMTKGKLIELSKITNTVSASESADRKRADLLVGANEKQRKVGQTILESDFGKSLLADIETQVKAGFSSADIGKNMGVQLSAAMLSGVIDSDQARSLAMAIGNELKDYPLSANIAAEIIQITGPNGENIKKDPLQVALDIDKKTFQTSKKMIDYASGQGFSYLNALGSYGGLMSATSTGQITGIAGGAIGRFGIGGIDRKKNTSTLIGTGGTLASAESARRGEKGLSHQIQQAINPAIYQDWYDDSKSGMDKFLSVISLGTTSTYFQIRDAKAASLKIQTAGAQLMVQELANNQQIIDSLNKQYDIKLKTAKTDKEREKIQEERAGALDAVNKQNQGQLNAILASKDKLGSVAWDAAIKGAVDELYPKGPMAAVKDAALLQLGNMPDSAFKTEMQLQFASNLIDPMTLIDLLSNEPFQKEYNILVDTTFKGDAAGASVFSQLMSKAGLGTDQKTNVTAMINDTTTYDKAMANAGFDEKGNRVSEADAAKNRATARANRQSEIDDIKAAVAALSQIQETYGINLDVNDNSVAKVQRIADMVKALGGKKSVTKLELGKMKDADPRYQYIFDNWEALVGDGLTMSATMLLNLETMVTDDMILQGYLQAAGTTSEIQTNELMQKGMIPSWAQDRTTKEKAAAYFAANPAKFKEIFGVEYEGQDPPVNVTDPLEFLQPLAMQLKQVRDNAFNALTPVKSLLEAFTNKKTQKDAFNLFDGIQNRLLRFGVGKDFREAIDSMSAEEFSKVAELTGDRALFTFEKDKPRSKDTITGLTDTGLAVDQGYRERNLGTFNLANEETIIDIQNQAKAYNILIGNGLSAAQALEVVADKSQAAAIAAGAISSSDPDWKIYISNIKESTTALERQAVLNDAIKANEEFRLYADMPNLVSQMKELGYSTDQVDAVLGNPKLAKFLVNDLKDGKLDAKEIADYLNGIEARKIIDIQVALNNGDIEKASQNGRQLVDELFAAQEGLILFSDDAKLIKKNEKEISDKQLLIAGFQQQIDELNDKIEDGQRKIEEAYTRPIEDLNEEINDLTRDLETNPLFGDRAIKKIQDESSILSNDLEIINHAADEVNKRYDEQAEALSEIQKINENIVEQQSNQLDLADALSKGDISAAAEAVQAMREANASQFASDQSDALEQARQNELNALVGPQRGLTAEQISEKQYENAQKIYEMENNPTRLSILEMIIGKQDQIYNYEESRELALRGIRKLEDAIFKIEEESIEPLQERIDKLIYENSVIQDRINKQIAELTVLGETRDTWGEINAKLDYAAAAFKALNGSKDLAGLLSSIRQIDATWTNILQTMSLYAGAIPSNGSVQDSINAIGGVGATAYVAPESTAEDIAAAAKFDSVVAELDHAQAALDSAQEDFDAAVKLGNAYGVRNAGVRLENAKARLAAAQIAYNATLPSSDSNNTGGGGGVNSFQYLATGGKVKPEYFETGKLARGTDTVPAMLTPGEFVVKKSAVKKYGSKFFKNLNDKKYPKKTASITPAAVLDIISRIGPSLDIKPKSSYDANNQPTGSPSGRYWGELERLYEGSPIGFDKNGKPIFNTTGKDPWGGTEIPGLPFSGKVANFSDYWHQLAEQPKASSSPGMGIDKTPDRYAGSGASTGGIGSGVYRAGGLQLFSRGGMVNPLMMHDGGMVGRPPHPNAPEGHIHHPDGSMTFKGKALTRDGNPAGFREIFRKSNWEQTANFFGLPSIGKTIQDLVKFGGPHGMIMAKLQGKEMKSSLGDNLTAALSVIPIPVMKLLKPAVNKISKIIPQGVKNFVSDPVKGLGIDMFSKLSTKLNAPKITSKPNTEPSLSKDTIEMIEKYKANIQTNIKEIEQLKNGTYLHPGTKEPVVGQEAENLINYREGWILKDKALIDLGMKSDLPPNIFSTLGEYTTYPTTAQGSNKEAIDLIANLRKIGKPMTVYRGLSYKDLGDIAGFRMMRNTRDMMHGIEWMKQWGHPMEVMAPGAAYAHGWLDNAADLIAASGKPRPRADDLENAAPFMWFGKGIKPGESWIPENIKSTTESLDWAKYIANQGGTGGGEAGAVARIELGSDVRGLTNLMDFGMGGTVADLTATEQLLAPYTNYILKEVNPLGLNIPGQGGFERYPASIGSKYYTSPDIPLGSGPFDEWVGGNNFSKLLDEYVFEANQTLPVPSIAGDMGYPTFNTVSNSSPIDSISELTSNSVSTDYIANVAARAATLSAVAEKLRTDALEKQNLQNAAKAEGYAKRGYASGGLVPKHFAAGGYASGTDTVPAMLTPGEFVIKKSSVDKYGKDFLHDINVQRLDDGGEVEHRHDKSKGNFFSRFNPVNAFSSMFSGMFNLGGSKTFKKSTNIKSKITQQQKDYMALQTSQLLSGYTSAFNLKNKTSPEIFGSKKLGVLADVLGVLPGVGLATRAANRATSITLQNPLLTKASSMFPKINSFTIPKAISNIKQKKGIKLSPWEKAQKDAMELAESGGFTPIESLLSADYYKLVNELSALTPKSGTFRAPKSGTQYGYNFYPAKVSKLDDESTVRANIENFAVSGHLGEQIGPPHKMVVTDLVSGQQAASLTWDSITGTIAMAKTEKAYEGQGLMRWLNEYAATFSRLKHSLYRTEQGKGYSTAIGGVMPDKIVIDRPLPINLAIYEALKTSGLGSSFEDRIQKMTASLTSTRAVPNEQQGLNTVSDWTDLSVEDFLNWTRRAQEPSVIPKPTTATTGPSKPVFDWLSGTWSSVTKDTDVIPKPTTAKTGPFRSVFDWLRGTWSRVTQDTDVIPKPDTPVFPEPTGRIIFPLNGRGTILRDDSTLGAQISNIRYGSDSREAALMDESLILSIGRAAIRKGTDGHLYYKAKGGIIPEKFVSGGYAMGTDTVPAMLTPGEFVMSRYAVQSHGADTMKAINNGSTVGESVYNYSINVNVKSDSNPDEIARAVMTQIKSIDSQKIRGVRV